MRYIFLLAFRFLFNRKGSMLTAGAAVAATIMLIIFNSIVVGGVVHGVERDLGDKQRGHVWISNKLPWVLVDDNLPETRLGQSLQVMFDQRFSTDLYHGFWQGVGQGTEALPATRRQDHGAHSVCSRI